MTAERAKIAKENRSAGELQARKITAEAEHERVRIEAEAAGAGARIRAQGDAEASRTYAAAFGQDAKFYQFLRTWRLRQDPGRQNDVVSARGCRGPAGVAF